MNEISTIMNQNISFLYSGQDRYCFETIARADVNNPKYACNIKIVVMYEEMVNMLLPLLNSTKMKGIIPSYGLKYFPIFEARPEETSDRLLQLMRIGGMSEENIYKVSAYLSFLLTLDDAVHNFQGQPRQVSLELIDRYSTISSVERAISNLHSSGIINYEQRFCFLQKYSEVKNAGPILENFLIALDNTFHMHDVCHRSISELSSGDIICFVIRNDLSEIRIKALLQLISYDLLDSSRMGHRNSLFIFEGKRKFGKEMIDFMAQSAGNCKVSFYADDFFAGHEDEWKNVMSGYFDAWIFSSHRLMSSCNSISEMFGTIPIVRTTYSVDRDRRFANNRFWDRMFNTNRVDHYIDHVPVYEPRFRQEDINWMPRGVCLVKGIGEANWVQI